MPDTTVNSEWNRITQYMKLSILMNLFKSFRIKWKAREEASRKGRGWSRATITSAEKAVGSRSSFV
jgi:hypothetical protein